MIKTYCDISFFPHRPELVRIRLHLCKTKSGHSEVRIMKRTSPDLNPLCQHLPSDQHVFKTNWFKAKSSLCSYSLPNWLLKCSSRGAKDSKNHPECVLSGTLIARCASSSSEDVLELKHNEGKEKKTPSSLRSHYEILNSFFQLRHLENLPLLPIKHFLPSHYHSNDTCAGTFSARLQKARSQKDEPGSDEGKLPEMAESLRPKYSPVWVGNVQMRKLWIFNNS